MKTAEIEKNMVTTVETIPTHKVIQVFMMKSEKRTSEMILLFTQSLLFQVWDHQSSVPTAKPCKSVTSYIYWRCTFGYNVIIFFFSFIVFAFIKKVSCKQNNDWKATKLPYWTTSSLHYSSLLANGKCKFNANHTRLNTHFSMRNARKTEQEMSRRTSSAYQISDEVTVSNSKDCQTV